MSGSLFIVTSSSYTTVTGSFSNFLSLFPPPAAAAAAVPGVTALVTDRSDSGLPASAVLVKGGGPSVFISLLE